MADTSSLPRAGTASLLRRFIELNKSASDWIERRLLPRRFTRSLLYMHELQVAELMAGYASPVMLDIGAGYLTLFARHREGARPGKIFGVDILQSQIANNAYIDGGLVADVCHSIPLRSDSLDLVVSRSVLEHLADNRTLFGEIARVLRPGGCCIHVFPCKYSPFALLNSLVPKRWSAYLLELIFPEWHGEVGFKTFYRDCYFPAMLERHAEAGLEVVTAELRFYQSVYYQFFLPFYLVAVAFDLVVYGLGIKRLGAQMLLICRKPAAAVASSGKRKPVAHAIPADAEPLMDGA